MRNNNNMSQQRYTEKIGFLGIAKIFYSMPTKLCVIT